MESLKKLLQKLDRREYTGNFKLSTHWIDLRNIWKRQGVNYLLDLKATKGMHILFFHYWTPVWHDNRGPYISIQIWKLRFQRGY